MTRSEIMVAWEKAALDTLPQQQTVLTDADASNVMEAFYGALEASLGVFPGQVQVLFRTWNELGHSEVLRISQKHGSKQACFRAYLAENLHNGLSLRPDEQQFVGAIEG